MLNVKIATAALLMVVGGSSFAVAATAHRVSNDRVVSHSTVDNSVYEGRSAYVAPAYDSQQPMINSQTGLNGLDNSPAH